MLDAAYVPTGIPELDDNPLVNRLPPLMGITDIYHSLEHIPVCRPAEKTLAPHLRAFLVVVRLRNTFIPTGPQATFAQKLHTLIRAGYSGVSLEDRGYAARLSDLIDQVEAGKQAHELVSRFSPTAYCGQLTGPSGMGKTTIIGRVLEGLDQVIVHEEPVTVQQIVYLRLQCPSNGSPKQLCLAFFQEIDKLLGTKYLKKFGRFAADHLVLLIAVVGQLHRLGLLVVDEIQFLRTAKTDEDEVLNLLTMLVNVINVPVLLVGTMTALPLLTKTFRTARRAEGIASATFEPLKPGSEWDRFLKILFRLQWTREETKLDEALSRTLWEESQGIVDIVMKLFILAQVQLMRRSETRSAPEIITPALIRRIAKEELRLVRPMLRALRRGSKTLARYDDLRPLDRHFAEILGGVTGDVELPDDVVASAPEPVDEAGAAAGLALALKSIGFAADLAAALVEKAKKEVPSGDPIAMLAAVQRMTAASPARKPVKRRKADPGEAAPADPEDVRRFVGAEGGGGAYAEMVAAGLVQPAVCRKAA